MRIIILILLFLLLTVVDAAITLRLNAEFPEGTELNPFITLSSWQAIVFAPTKILIYAIFLVAIAVCELNSQQLSSWSQPLPSIVMLAYLPLFLIAVKALAVINNLMPFLGFSTPVSYLLLWMELLPGSRGTHYALIWSTMFLLLAPLGVRVVRWMYTP